ncbi:MAG TPA: glycoside hydrolase family 76 protein [Oculatellaceae cyanobacterium]
MTTYLKAAIESFALLFEHWNHGKDFDGNTFWFAGNILHGAVDYFGVMQDSGVPDNTDAEIFVLDALKVFDSIINEPDPLRWAATGFWLDDFGWWGVAFARALMRLQLNDSLKERVKKYADNCWICMHNGWDDSLVGPDVPIRGGVPNTTNDAVLAGKNCVTNSLFWLLSLMLHNLEKNSKYIDPKTNSDEWYQQAINLRLLFSDENLVRERFKGAPNFVDWPWLGDQGLFLQCCKTIEVTDPKRKFAVGLADAVAAYRVRPSGVISEGLFPIPKNQSTYWLAYATGKGIFMRNLQLLNSSLGIPGPYADWIKTNATAVWTNRLKNNMFPFYWDKELPEPASADWGYKDSIAPLVLHASGMSALTAAASLFPNEEIPGSNNP